MTRPSVVADSATTLFNFPEFPDGSTCKQSLQVAPNVGDMTVGQTVVTEYGPSVILAVEVGKWRFSDKAKHRLTFRELDSGEEYARSYFPAAPLIHNQELFFGHPLYHTQYSRCGCAS